MEEPTTQNKREDISGAKDSKFIQEISTNWRLTQDNKRLCDAVSTISSSTAATRFTVDDIVTDDSCVILQPANANVDDKREACMVDINLTKGQRITRIAVVSEASVLEFFKESGEYADTKFAEIYDEFEDATVYFVELAFQKPTSEASIKFTRIHNSRSNMYLYGIMLVLEDEKSPLSDLRAFQDILRSSRAKNIATGTNLPMRMPDFSNVPAYDGDFATEMSACLQSFVGKAWGLEKPRKDVAALKVEEKKEVTDETEKAKQTSIELYIDQKFRDMEERLVQRINEAEARNSIKLDAILKHLETRSSS